jgi:cyclohexanone monooxygenase
MTPAAQAETKSRATCDAVVVGAGFAGLYAIHRLRELGLSLRGFEAAPDVGGVWFWNRYPGARCDVESMQYSYGFSDPLQQDWGWSERFAQQAEILSYIRHVAERFDLRREIAFDTRVEAATFDEASNLWEVRTDRGDIVTARFCIMASGPLSIAKLPEIPGIGSFAGRFVHTGAWPDAPIDFAGQRVGIVGTGSSGVQAVPVVAAQAKHLTVFQRTPNFVIPARNRPLDPETERNWKADYAGHRERARQVGTFYEFSDRPAMSVGPQEREAEYERRWREGGVNFVHAFNDIYLDAQSNETAADFVRAKIRGIVADPAVAERLCPKDHPLGAKRICVGSDYYETFNQANVTLVDLKDEPIEAVTPAGVRTGRGEHALDMLIFATGYDALTGALARIDIRGRDGLALAEKWDGGPQTYLGLMTAGFPNLFIITGPGSPSVLVNMIVGLEQHVEWIARCLSDLRTRGVETIEAERQAERDWVAHVNAEADKTLFVKAASWYLGANVPGKPRVFMPYVGGIGRYRRKCDEVAAAGYEGFMLGGDASRRTSPVAARA